MGYLRKSAKIPARKSVILSHLRGTLGYEALEKIQGSAKTRDIPVVAISADAMPSDIEKGLKAGFEDYITKPLKVDQLLGALQRALSKADAG